MTMNSFNGAGGSSLMSEAVILVYTTIGGVLGAGLTQYVTHVRDRRAARALVVEKLADVEDAYAELRWRVPSDHQPPSRSLLARPLASLEGAGLVAGVPRAILNHYIGACRIYENSHRILDQTQVFVDELANTVTGQVDQIAKSGNTESVSKSLGTITENAKLVGTKVNQIDDPVFRLHNVALEELGMALWSPIRLQFHRRKLRNTQRLAEAIEKSSKDLATTVRGMEELSKRVAPPRSRLEGTEISEGDRSLDIMPAESDDVQPESNLLPGIGNDGK